MIQLISGLFILLTSLSAIAAEPSERSILVVPIASASETSSGLNVLVPIPCGAKFYGFIITPRPDIKKFELAAAVETNSYMCARMTRLESKKLDHLTLKPSDLVQGKFAKRVLSDINSRGMDFITPYEIRLLKIPPRGKTKETMQLVYESKGGKYAGIIVKPSNSDELSMGVMEIPDRAVLQRKKRPELSPPKVANFPLIVQADVLAVKPLEKEKSDLSKDFDLKLAKIKPHSFRKTKEGFVKVSYFRSCNEAPIGIVLWNPRKKTVNINTLSKPIQNAKFEDGFFKKDQELFVGVLLARYYHMSCKHSDKIPESDPNYQDGSWDEIINKDLRLPAGNPKITYVKQKDPAKSMLRLKSPTQYAFLNEAGHGVEGLRVDGIGGCNRELGTVFSRDAKGNPVIGILDRNAVYPCKKAAKKISLFQPVTLVERSDKPIYPMKIIGLN